MRKYWRDVFDAINTASIGFHTLQMIVIKAALVGGSCRIMCPDSKVINACPTPVNHRNWSVFKDPYLAAVQCSYVSRVFKFSDSCVKSIF